MGNEIIERHFGLLGARVKINEISQNWRNSGGIDIRNDKSGEYFDIRINTNEQISYEVVDLRTDLRHLLLLARTENGKEKFLCGHDERHWFVCAVPGKSVANVVSAMEALQPIDVKLQINAKLKRRKNRFERRNEAFIRQGEWFFIPAPDLKFKESLTSRVFKNEPISRGRGGKPHWCEEIFRTSGETVMVCSHYPSGVVMSHYNQIIKSNEKAAKWNWRAMQRNARVYARGRVRHPDHKTIVLDGWHRVLMNTENEAPGMRHVVFLD